MRTAAHRQVDYDMTTILIQQASPGIQYASLFKPWGSALAAWQGGGRCNLCQHKYSGTQWHLRCSRGKAAQSSEFNIDAPPPSPPLHIATTFILALALALNPIFTLTLTLNVIPALILTLTLTLTCEPLELWGACLAGQGGRQRGTTGRR